MTVLLTVQDDSVIVFKDIKPAASHHYLVCPKRHIPSITHVTQEDISLIEEMKRVGERVLLEQRSDSGDHEAALLGFHWPPFNMVSHLHLHVIAPPTQMSFISRCIFRRDSWWFCTVDTTLQYLRKKFA